jgi:putative ABC transport system permease protein
MLRIALTMLLGDKPKYLGLLVGITATAFLIAMVQSLFFGVISRSHAIVDDTPACDVWVMDPAVESADETINMPATALERVRGVAGVAWAVPMHVGGMRVRMPHGKFRSVQVLGIDDATLIGLPTGASPHEAAALRGPGAALMVEAPGVPAIVVPVNAADAWAHGPLRLDAPTRPASAGDELLVNDHSVRITGTCRALPRIAPQAMLITTYTNAVAIRPPERTALTFVLVKAQPGIAPEALAARISADVGLRARSAAQFRADNIRYQFGNPENVGHVALIAIIAIVVGAAITGQMLYMFTTDNIRFYAVLKAMGAMGRTLAMMVIAQALAVGCIGIGLGLGLTVVVGLHATQGGFGFRMMWFTPPSVAAIILFMCVLAGTLSMVRVLRLSPSGVFAS